MKRVKKVLVNGDKLTLPLLTAEEGLNLAMIICKYPFSGYVNNDTKQFDIPDGSVMQLLLNMSDDDSDVFQSTLLDGLTINGDEIDPDTYYSGNYRELSDILQFAFEQNFKTYMTYIVNPFEKPDFRYDGVVDSVYSTMSTDAALQKVAQLDYVTTLFHYVYFSKMTNETLESLQNMPLGDFIKLKVAIDIRSSVKQEVDNNQYRMQKSQNGKR